MTQYIKIKADSDSHTFLYVLEKQAEKYYIILKKALYPWEKSKYLFFRDLEVAELQYNQLIS